MCEPTTIMMGISLAVAVAGTVTQTMAQSASDNYQAQVNMNNAILADRRAQDALERGQMEEERKLREGTALRKQQEASFAAANIDTSFGSPLDFIVSSAMNADLDAAIIRSNAEREAEDFEYQAAQYRGQAAVHKSSAKNAVLGGVLTGVGQIASGASGMYANSPALQSAFSSSAAPMTSPRPRSRPIKLG